MSGATVGFHNHANSANPLITLMFVTDGSILLALPPVLLVLAVQLSADFRHFSVVPPLPYSCEDRFDHLLFILLQQRILQWFCTIPISQTATTTPAVTNATSSKKFPKRSTNTPIFLPNCDGIRIPLLTQSCHVFASDPYAILFLLRKPNRNQQRHLLGPL